MLNSDFNFMTPVNVAPTEPQYVGPNLEKAARMTPKKFANSVLAVFDKLGGASWLLTQAEADPKSFLELLKRMIPKSVQLDDLQGIQINLIDQFGNTVQIQSEGGGVDNRKTANSPGTATSGSLLGSVPPPAEPTGSTDITITDIFN